jgi:Na+/melibiose symporter-like transporter
MQLKARSQPMTPVSTRHRYGADIDQSLTYALTRVTARIRDLTDEHTQRTLTAAAAAAAAHSARPLCVSVYMPAIDMLMKIALDHGKEDEVIELMRFVRCVTSIV